MENLYLNLGIVLPFIKSRERLTLHRADEQPRAKFAGTMNIPVGVYFCLILDGDFFRPLMFQYAALLLLFQAVEFRSVADP